MTEAELRQQRARLQAELEALNAGDLPVDRQTQLSLRDQALSNPSGGGIPIDQARAGAPQGPSLAELEAMRARARAQLEAIMREPTPMPTTASRDIPARQENVRRPPPATGDWVQQLGTNVGRFFSGEGQRQEGVAEIGQTSIPERRDVRWEGGPISGLVNMLPRPVRAWLDAEGRAAQIGLGFFLDPNEEHRAEIIRHNVPTAEFRRDEYGNLQVRWDANNPWAYINRPGASWEDALTLANEIERYVITSRLMRGGRAPPAGATSPLLTTAGREAVAGGVSVAGGQQLATTVGGPGVDLVDTAIGAGGGATGAVIGHGIAAVPGVVRQIGRAIDDRLPGAAQRAAERAETQAAAHASRIAAAREQAAAQVNAWAQREGVTGERLARAVANAETEAETRIAAELTNAGPGPAARELFERARSLGIDLSRSQSEMDDAGVKFLHDAAQDHYGIEAGRQARDFLARQAAQVPQALRSVAGDQAVSSPQAGVGAVRAGMQSVEEAGTQAERQAWEQFNTHADRYIRTYDKTPRGNPSGVARVLGGLDETLAEEKVFLQLPEYATQYPQVAQVMSLARRMNEATRADLPIHDVDRVIQLKRFIDSAWESAGTRGERRILTSMGRVVRDWLRDAAAFNEGVPAHLSARAGQTAGYLRNALAASQQNIQRFRENPIIADMLERVRPNTAGQPEGALVMTDQEVTRRVFGGGEQGLNISGEGVQALRTMKEVLGASSPEWEGLRQAALQRLTAGLDTALLTRQSQPIITAIKNVQTAFNANREAMHVLFSPEELNRMMEWQQVARALAPPARNPVNSSGTADTALRVGRGIIQAMLGTAKGIPLGVGEVTRAVDNSIATARVATETSGAAGPTQNIARAFADLWNVDRNVAGTGGAIGSAYETEQRNNNRVAVP